jgi:diphosphomevalonate decarboxylase
MKANRKATARANTNIALIKYWGKRDESRMLPMNSSLSITLDCYYTITTVDFREELKEDHIILNSNPVSKNEHNKISTYLDIIRDLAGVQLYANIISENHVPTAAGFASSASGYAALAAAATKAIGLSLSLEELSGIARLGSGSACRSIYGGFVEWEMGDRDDGIDSKARQILSEDDWNITILSVVIASDSKKISSREGMKRTVETSPFYKGWLDTISNDLAAAKKAIQERNFRKLGEVAEENALKMHATMLGAKPPIIYWESGTLEVIHCIHELRQAGIPVYFTIDAGPNVKVLCLPDAEEEVKKELQELGCVQTVITCHPGGGIRYLS